MMKAVLKVTPLNLKQIRMAQQDLEELYPLLDVRWYELFPFIRFLNRTFSGLRGKSASDEPGAILSSVKKVIKKRVVHLQSQIEDSGNHEEADRF